MNLDYPWLLTYGYLLWLILLACATGSGVFVVWVRPRRAARRQAAQARERMGGPLSRASDLEGDAELTLVGTLRTDGRTCDGFADGTAAAAASAWAGEKQLANIQAKQLTIVLSDETTVELDGPAQVLAGSKETRRGATRAGNASPMRSALAS